MLRSDKHEVKKKRRKVVYSCTVLDEEIETTEIETTMKVIQNESKTKIS